ncbi:hypothetical protein [Paenibacillus spongiae]|uniref:YhfM-like domain-containing protein n=1 Tax=Paenibacillus spongiae TaxID=2909671 RepID=A0ABY5SB09_9BACL|nr:hypothetical protein [Paenibacillus spongiae]UVI29715.1 hypothetical protein L1F29_30640 [Paenibacillus spongiae]
MRKNVMFILMTFALLVLAGCGSAKKEAPTGLNQLDASRIEFITLQHHVNNQSHEITDNKAISRFVHAISDAEYDQGKLDIAAPAYGASVEMKDGASQQFSFWIDGETTGLFIVSGQNGHYRLSETAKNELRDLFQADAGVQQSEVRTVIFKCDSSPPLRTS